MTLELNPIPRSVLASFHVSSLQNHGYRVELWDLQAVEPPSELPPLRRINDAAKALALTAPLTHFRANLAGGADTWDFDAGEIGMATLAFQGDASVDARLLMQVRHLLVPGNEPSATGGYPDQKQVCATGTFLLAKNTPRIWNAFNNNEKKRIDVIMTAVLVSSSYTCSDHNDNVITGQKQHDITGNWLGRDWNPNFQNGFVGQCLMASMYFGANAAQQILFAHDHVAFFAKCKALNLINIVKSYDFSGSNASDAPSAATIDKVMHETFEWHGHPLSDLMGMYELLTNRTYSRNVNAGLNDGKGEMGSNGKLGGMLPRAVQAELSNVGALGMMHEFETGDGSGKRSSTSYTYDGWYVNNYLHWALVALGHWKSSAKLVQRIRIGTEDWRYKYANDYVNYDHGASKGSLTLNEKRGFTINNELHEAVMEWHGS